MTFMLRSWKTAYQFAREDKLTRDRTRRSWFQSLMFDTFGHEPFSAQQAAEVAQQPRKRALRELRALQTIEEMKAHMFRFKREKIAKPTSPTNDLKQAVQAWALSRKVGPTDAFKLARIHVTNGVQWLSGRIELTPSQLERLEKVVKP